MCKLKQAVLTLLLILVTSFVEAQNSAVEPLPIKIHLKNGEDKVVQIIHFHVPSYKRDSLANNISILLHRPKNREFLLARKAEQVELGMANVPVLDQGVWGTCATFAVTAAIDALLKLEGEQTVSQLCNLELGRTINNPDDAGGWNGSFGDKVLEQISEYGYLAKDYQHTKGCGGLKEYPLYDEVHNGKPLPISTFKENAAHQFSTANWHVIQAHKHYFSLNTEAVGEQVLKEVKTALVNKHRIVFGTLLVPFLGEAGAIGKYDNVQEDTWVLTPEIEKNIRKGTIGGHEMIIVGFDDSACATFEEKTPSHDDDPTGDTDKNRLLSGRVSPGYVHKEEKGDKPLLEKQCGLLHLRNSWSEMAGDQGDYYMTYAYFKLMMLEAYELTKEEASDESHQGGEGDHA